MADRLPSVAICIPTFNQAAFLGDAVRSAVLQDYAGELGVWVSDDASTDDTPQVLDDLCHKYENVRVLRQPCNIGMAANSSSLMRAAEADLLVRLDSDDELEPSFVTRMVDLMRSEPSAGYGHSAVTEIDERGHARRYLQLARTTGYQDADAALRASIFGNRTVANVVMFRRSALGPLEFGDGRPDFGEDYYIAVRMADAGYGNVYVDEPLARRRMWEDEGGSRSRRKASQISGFIRIFDEVLEPAWDRRHWSLAPARRQRRRLAAEHCASCFAPQFTHDEREHLIALLRQLGDGRRLRLRLGLCQIGLAPWIEAGASLRRRAKMRSKTAIKPLLPALRPLSERMRRSHSA